MFSEEDYDENCPICFDEIKFPKLLPCRHTFCKTCLNLYVQQKQTAVNENVFACPMCRTNCKIPKGGVQNLPTNFFVEDKILSVGHQCPKCSYRLPTEDAQCRRCVSEKMKADGSSQFEDEKEYSDQYRVIPPSFVRHIRMNLHHIHTNFRATLLSSVTLGDVGLLASPGITALGPTHDNKCWVVRGYRPQLIKINSSGEIVTHISVWPQIMEIYDVACRRDSVVLLLSMLQPNVYGIVKMDERNRIFSRFVGFKNFRGEVMELFPDERIAVAGTAAKRSNESEWVERYRTLYVISKDGDLISVLESEKNKLNIMCLAINPITGLVLVCRTSRFVEVMLETGIQKGKFRGSSPLSPCLTEISIFNPNGLCCDKNGYIIACDEASGMLYVMSPTGNVRGIVTTETAENVERRPFGKPFLTACSSSGDIWVGDRENGKVRLYSITNYVNNLHRFPF